MHSSHFPSSFYPRTAYPGRVSIEDRVPVSVMNELSRRGHEVIEVSGWVNGKVMGIHFDADRGVISGAVVAKGTIGYALAW